MIKKMCNFSLQTIAH